MIGILAFTCLFVFIASVSSTSVPEDLPAAAIAEAQVIRGHSSAVQSNPALEAILAKDMESLVRVPEENDPFIQVTRTACPVCNTEVLRVLLSHGARIEKVDSFGDNALARWANWKRWKS